jgi:hypothetical protein
MANTKPTLQQVQALLAAERKAKNVYYASAQIGTKADKNLYSSMVAATKLRKAAMTAYAASF